MIKLTCAARYATIDTIKAALKTVSLTDWHLAWG